MRLGLGIWLGVLQCAIALSGCERGQTSEKPVTPVRVTTVSGLANASGLRYSASVAPHAQVDLAFKVNGYVREILQLRGADGRMRDAQQGDAFARGTVLARVREEEYIDRVKKAKESVAKAQASLQKATQDFRRASDLKATQSITAPDYDKAKWEFETAQASVAQAKAQLDEAELNLQYCALRAPIDGVLLQRNIEVGSLVGPGTVGFVIANVSSVKVVFGVPDVMLKNLKLGDPLTVTTASAPGVEFKGRVTAIAPSADTQNRVFEVEVTVPNPRHQLKVGMVAALQVPEGALPEASLIVPLAAIVRSPSAADEYALFVVEDVDGKSVAHVRNVKLGEVYGNNVAVTTGLHAGERVIVTGAQTVLDGQPVRIIP
ncbi:MAG: efflux RND transporter periplasmic adaptor subunit [Acidiferrobacterales bacterium]|nr:efflux RND transporter periplasmic adaptor subunit [Acidiferrobacterales bacterium]